MNNADFYFQTKLHRLIKLIHVLHVHTTLARAARKLEVSTRTVRRDVAELAEMGFRVEVDSFSQYHITNECCPLCGKIKSKKNLAE